MKRSTKVSRHEKRIAKIDLKIAVKTREIRELDKAMARLHAKRTKLEEDRRELNFDRADLEDRMGAERLEFARRFIEDGNESHPSAMHGLTRTEKAS